MKYFLLFLAVFSTTAVEAVTWVVPAVTGSYPSFVTSGMTGGPYNASFYRVYEKTGGGTTPAASNVTSAQASPSNPATGGGSVSIIASSQLDNTNVFTTLRVKYGVRNSLGTQVRYFAWAQCYKTGNVNPLLGGPIVDGVPKDPAGNDVDDAGVSIVPPPDRYYASAEYHNTNDFAVTVHYVYTETGPPPAVILIGQLNCQPGQKVVKDGYNDAPFKIVLTATSDGRDIGDPVESIAEEVDDDDPDHPDQPQTGQPGGPGGPVNAGGGTRPGGDQVDKPMEFVPRPRPGTTEGNAEARHEESTGELKRIVDQLNTMANQAADDADKTNELLDKIEENTGDGEDEGDGEGDTPDIIENPGNAADSLGVQSKMENIKAAGAGAATALTGLVSALHLEGQYSSAAWAFTIPFANFGTIEIDFETWPQWIFTAVRGVLLFFVGLRFVGLFMDAFRSAFA